MSDRPSGAITACKGVMLTLYTLDLVETDSQRPEEMSGETAPKCTNMNH